MLFVLCLQGRMGDDSLTDKEDDLPQGRKVSIIIDMEYINLILDSAHLGCPSHLSKVMGLW